MTLDLDSLPYIEAANYGRERTADEITMIVVHTPQAPELSGTAEAVANYFASGATIGSTQLVVDDDSAVRCVPDLRRANGAGEGDSNRCGLHIEVAGYAEQDAADWADAYSAKAVANAADLARQWIVKYPNIRPIRITAERLKAGERYGICGHADYHEAYPGGAYRSDPGAEFPWDGFLALITNQSKGAPMGTLLYSTDTTAVRYLEFPICSAGLPQALIDHYAQVLGVPIFPVTEEYAAKVSSYCNGLLDLGPVPPAAAGGASAADIAGIVRAALNKTKLAPDT